MISVIVPVYNAEGVLKTAIESVLNQTYSDFELLLIDDGSTDASPSICDYYASQDSRVKVIHKKNGGVSSARNCGLDVARGEYISFLDNDDSLYPEFLETMIDNVQNYDYLLSSYISGGGDQRDLLPRQKTVCSSVSANSIDEIREKAIKLCLMDWGIIWCTMFRKDILDRNNIRFPNTQYEDIIFLYEYLLHCNSLRAISYEGYYRYYHTDSQGHSHKYIAEEDALTLIDKVFYEVITQFGLKDEYVISHFKGRLRTAIVCFLRKGYYADTRVGYKQRMKRWNEMKSWPFLLSPFKGEIKGIDQLVYLISKLSLFYIIDPAMLVAASIKKML